MTIPFVRLDDARYGESVRLSPLIRRVVAANPSKYTGPGTGTYIVGNGDVAVIDPGPIDEAHRDALDHALAGERIRWILVTHCHADHSPLAAWLRERSGAPTIAFGPHPRPPGDAGGGVTEGVTTGEAASESADLDFVPDLTARDGSRVAAGDGWAIDAVHTPGHTSNHLSFALDAESTLFTGDHVMGWSTSVVSPPDGDMRDYVASLRKVISRGDRVLMPTHGPPVTEPGPFLRAYLAHRLEREAQVLDSLRAGCTTVGEIVARLYADVRPELHEPAGRTVLAHLVKLIGEGAVAADGPATTDTRYAVADGPPPA